MSEGYMRFEEVCEAYIAADDASRKEALSLMTEKERQTFLQGVAQYRYFTQPWKYKEAINEMGGAIYRRLRAEKNATP